MELLSWLEQSALGTWISESPSLWAYPLVLTLHTVGMSMLVGANAAVDVRLLGFADDLPIAPLEKLFPLMWAGFWINAVSGCALFAGHATEKAVQPVFYVKLACVALAMTTVVQLRRRAFPAAAAPGGGPLPPSVRVMAAVSLVLWTGAITAGRLMAYL